MMARMVIKTDDVVETMMDAEYGERNRSYSHLHVNFEEIHIRHLEELNKGVQSQEVRTNGASQ